MESTLQEFPPRARRRGEFVARAVAAFPVAMKTGTASMPGVGYHVNYVGVGPLPHPTIAFCVRVTGQPTSVHVSKAAREVLAALLEGLATRPSLPANAAD